MQLTNPHVVERYGSNWGLALSLSRVESLSANFIQHQAKIFGTIPNIVICLIPLIGATKEIVSRATSKSLARRHRPVSPRLRTPTPHSPRVFGAVSNYTDESFQPEGITILSGQSNLNVKRYINTGVR